jgi:hypothetical protein
MKKIFANAIQPLIEETTMLARVSAALLGVALFAGTASAQETTSMPRTTAISKRKASMS